MRYYILFLFFLNCFYNTFSQKILEGNIQDDKGTPIVDVSITIHNTKKQEILAFALSDSKGNYKISWPANNNSDSLQLKVSMLGYAKQVIVFSPKADNYFSFILQPYMTELPNVAIKNNRVYMHGDTLNYNAQDFSQKQDMVIGDIIKRLPGIEVSSAGQIKYNGKAITNYYIEGLDLLEDRYGIANNNIPADAVDKIQVLENHQPIKALDSLVFSDRAALNIKLKSSAKVNILGKAKLGLGTSPLLSDDELVAMMFKKKFQFINTYKYNNIGANNTKEITAQNISEYINATQNNSIKQDLLFLPAPVTPSIAEKRYLINNEHIASVNQLIPLNKDYQLRINTAFINDYQTRNSQTLTRYIFPNDSVIIFNENLNHHNNLNRLQGNFALTANNKDFYLNNSLKFQTWWAKGASNFISGDNNFQILKNPFFNVYNDFRILKAKKNVTEFTSYIGFSLLPQNLNIRPGQYNELLNNNLPYSALQQDVSLRTIYMDNSFSFKKKKNKINFDYKIGFSFQSQYFYSQLSKEYQGASQKILDSFQNHLYWSRLQVYNDNQWAYSNGNFRVTFALPVKYNFINYHDNFFQVKNSVKKLFINPNAIFQYYISQYWNVNFSAGYDNNFSDISNINTGYVLRNYRTLLNNNAPLAKINAANLSATFVFRNPLKIAFFNLGILLSKNKTNLLYSQQFYNNLETQKAVVKNNYQNNIILFSRLSKYFVALKTSGALNINYTLGNQQQLQQNLLVKFTNQNFVLNINLSSKVSSLFNTEYNANFSTYLSKSQIQNNRAASTFNQDISLNIFATARWIIKLTGEHYYVNNISALKKAYFFCDFGVKYRLKNKKIEFETALLNIFNTKNFSTIYFNNNVESISDYQIRPVQLVGKIHFTF